MKIAIGNDHAGTDYKFAILKSLQKEGHTIVNMGTDGSESVNYPDFAHAVARAVAAGEVNLGILICGSGNGVAMTANKHKGIRAALCWNQELAALARGHNDANILAIPARFVSLRMAKSMVKAFLHTTFEGGRHATRVNCIPL
jgi:ribose 5-phosphate isomerase B